MLRVKFGKGISSSPTHVVVTDKRNPWVTLDLTVRYFTLLTIKVVTLCTLASVQRYQILYAINLNECHIGITSSTFNIRELLKHNKSKQKNKMIHHHI